MHHNVSVLIGRMSGPCKLTYTPTSGKAVANLRLAVSRGTKDSEGKDVTDWFDVVVWEKQAEYVTNYGGKGRLLLCQGAMHNRLVRRQDGFEYWKTEMVAQVVRFLDPKPQAPAADTETAAEGEGAGSE